MRIVSWNMGGGFEHDHARHADGWAWVQDCAADVFLLQEAVPPAWPGPEGFATETYREKANASQPRWGSTVLTRSPGWLTYFPDDGYQWLSALTGSCAIASPAFPGLPWLISLHSNATAVASADLAASDLSGVLRCDETHTWEVDLIAHDLSRLLNGEPFIAGGDLNSSRLLDVEGGTANARLFANLSQAGFHDLRTPPHPAPEPRTFLRAQARPLQLDYLLADAATAQGATEWTVLNEVVTEFGLSDHAPIQIEVDYHPRATIPSHSRGDDQSSGFARRVVRRTKELGRLDSTR